MIRYGKLGIILVAVLALSLSGCATPSEDNSQLEGLEEQLEEKNQEIESLNLEILGLREQLQDLEAQGPQEPLPSISGPTPGASILSTSMEVIELIGAMDMTDLQDYVHPSAGVRFSPYSYVDLQEDIVIQASQFPNLPGSSTEYIWGIFDGIGDPIQMTFDDYYNRFIYDTDFANPEIIGNNTKIGMGNVIDNVDTAYPNGQFVEFHFSGFDPQYEGMDWRSLKLVFEEHAGAWYLVGIIHGEWTI